MPTISICIITYNRAKELLELLQSLLILKNYKEVVEEVIVMNNNSTDDYSMVEAFINQHQECKIRYIVSDVNHGVAVGRNIIMQQAKGKYLYAIDDDVEFNHGDDLIKLAALFTKPKHIDNNTAVIVLEIFYHSTKERQKTAFPHKKLEKYKNKEWFLTGHFIGAASLYRKDVLDKVGYFPEDIIYGMEEYDLSFRIIDAGYTIAYDNSVRVWHKESPKGRMPTKEKLSVLWHNKAMVFWTYMPLIYFFSVNFFWGSRYLLLSKGNINGFFSTCKRILHSIKKRKRKKINKHALKYLKQTEARLWF